MFLISFVGITNIIVTIMAKGHISHSTITETVHIINIKTYGISVLYAFDNRFNTSELVLPQFIRCGGYSSVTFTLAYPLVNKIKQTVRLTNRRIQ